MKNKVLLVAAGFIVASFMGVGAAMADEVLPGAAIWQDPSVMGVSQSVVERGARTRAATDALNRASGATRAYQGGNSGINTYFQFGSSQSDQSWKKARTVEEAEVVGLVAGDCRGDNSDNSYRKMMNQNRKGYMKERLVPNSMCGDYHPTLK
ncbi:MAG: hypothetical protein ACE5ER_00345 [Nitrospinaceae bacterium]